ncbi:M3 family oligoendopeptidase [uncultured Secundilactobacillus sp.]|uniref:M3 family oligoendopeptidase n=1 Tax=uncultured Secundilactobacillus sp. TaxID=2813935 RepID=UPI002597D70D|nr:M3 family oligoendopeptidase [uncultured Secundilactobacillus sp.]
MTYSLNWDLDSIFSGGVHSPALTKKITTLLSELTDLDQAAKATEMPIAGLADFIAQLQKTAAGVAQVSVFATALQSDDITNEAVKPLLDQTQQLQVRVDTIQKGLQRRLSQLSETDFHHLLEAPQLGVIAFNLTEMRQLGQTLLPADQEHLISQLNLDGLHAWSSHYDSLVSQVTVPFHRPDGTPITLSAGQADNQLLGNPDVAYRSELLPAWEAAWTDKQALFADNLNHLAGSRLTDYAAHGIDDVLQQPLMLNRLSRKTLDTIWQVVTAHKQPLLAYLDRKAALMGKSQAGWQDVEAPLHLGNQKPRQFTYDQAATFIIKQFGAFSPKMAELAKYAFDHHWIEAEDRPNKQPGGYMESLPETGESRIFLTFTGSVNDAATIAHELGHAFHSRVMTDLPYFRQNYAMNVAETASTFAEMIVADANVAEAKTPAEKLMLLDAKMVNPLAMFLNIHARYLFETRFYEQRKQGVLTPSALNTLMLQAQEEAFDHRLSSYSPHFWASKGHFYIDDVPFYNFPYTFGYLFSLGLYAKAQTTKHFESAYIALLRDTANMSTEALAQKHLGVDLTQPEFWEAGTALIEKDVAEFMRLSRDF